MASKNTAPGADEFHVLSVRNFETGVSFNDPSLGQDIQVLFSPDESVIVIKAEDNFRGVGFAAISIHDMQRNRAISGPGPGLSCSACFALSATMSSYRDVRIMHSGRNLGPCRVE